MRTTARLDREDGELSGDIQHTAGTVESIASTRRRKDWRYSTAAGRRALEGEANGSRRVDERSDDKAIRMAPIEPFPSI